MSQIYESFIINKFKKEGFDVLQNVFLYENRKLVLLFIDKKDINLKVYNLTKEKFLKNGYSIVEFIVNNNNFQILKSDNHLINRNIDFVEFFSTYNLNLNIEDLDTFIIKECNKCKILNTQNENNELVINNNGNNFMEYKLLQEYFKTYSYDYINKLRLFIVDFLLKDINWVINLDGIIENENSLYILELKMKSMKYDDFFINIGEYHRHQTLNNIGFKIEYFWIRVFDVNIAYDYLIKNNLFPKETQFLHYSFNKNNVNIITNSYKDNVGQGKVKKVYTIPKSLFHSCYNLKSIINRKKFLDDLKNTKTFYKIETYINYILCDNYNLEIYSSYLNKENQLFYYLGNYSEINNKKIFIRQVISIKSKLLKITQQEVFEMQKQNIKYIFLIYCKDGEKPLFYGVIPLELFLQKSYLTPINLTNNLNAFNNYIDSLSNYNKTNEDLIYATYFRPYTNASSQVLYDFIEPKNLFKNLF